MLQITMIQKLGAGHFGGRVFKCPVSLPPASHGPEVGHKATARREDIWETWSSCEVRRKHVGYTTSPLGRRTARCFKWQPFLAGLELPKTRNPCTFTSTRGTVYRRVPQ